MSPTYADDSRVCVLCHQPGGWLFRDYGEDLAHTDCMEAVGVDDRPTLAQLQRAENQMLQLGYVFRDSCARMCSGIYHDQNVRRYHIFGHDYHFASWASYQRWLDNAFSYWDMCEIALDAEEDTDWD